MRGRELLIGPVQVTTSNGEAYNVATEISTEVYNQLASWYNEDGDSAGNGTLPLAPSGPGSQPKQQNAFVKFWTQNWGKAWFIAVVVVIAVVAAGESLCLPTLLTPCSFLSRQQAHPHHPHQISQTAMCKDAEGDMILVLAGC